MEPGGQGYICPLDYGISNTVKSQVLTRVTNEKIGFLGVLIYEMCFKTRCGSIGISHFALHKCKIKVTRKVHISEKRGKNVGSLSYFQKKRRKK